MKNSVLKARDAILSKPLTRRGNEKVQDGEWNTFTHDGVRLQYFYAKIARGRTLEQVRVTFAPKHRAMLDFQMLGGQFATFSFAENRKLPEELTSDEIEALDAIMDHARAAYKRYK